jgi:GMP synthase (glutamine-hydrolysing)
MVGDRILGIQGHPEFTKDYVKTIIEDRNNRIGVEKAKQGIESLKQSTDNQLVGAWIRNFLYLM